MGSRISWKEGGKLKTERRNSKEEDGQGRRESKEEIWVRIGDGLPPLSCPLHLTLMELLFLGWVGRQTSGFTAGLGLRWVPKAYGKVTTTGVIPTWLAWVHSRNALWAGQLGDLFTLTGSLEWRHYLISHWARVKAPPALS